MSSSWKNPFYIRERMEAADVELTDDSTSDMNAQNIHISSEPQDTSSSKSNNEMRLVTSVIICYLKSS